MMYQHKINIYSLEALIKPQNGVITCKLQIYIDVRNHLLDIYLIINFEISCLVIMHMYRLQISFNTTSHFRDIFYFLHYLLLPRYQLLGALSILTSKLMLSLVQGKSFHHTVQVTILKLRLSW